MRKGRPPGAALVAPGTGGLLRHPKARLPGPEEAVLSFIHGLPETRRNILVAFSGGPDSMALLSAIAAAGKAVPLRLGAAWVNHRLRPEAELAREEALVRAFCDRLAIPLAVMEAADGLIASAAADRGLEDAARRERYRLLEEARREGGYDWILTAHTADDQAETIIMRVLGGSSSAGLSGIPARRGVFVRPFLGLDKASLLSYLDGLGLSYSVDSTNDQADYLRNRVRRELIPVIANLFPGYGRALAALAAKASDEDRALSAWAATALDREGADAIKLASLPPAVRERAIYAILDASGLFPAGIRIPWAMARRASERLGLVTSGAKAGEGLVLGSFRGVDLALAGGRVLARPGERVGRADRRDLPDRGKGAGFSLVIETPGAYRIAKGPAVEVYYADAGLRTDAFSWPLVLRSFRPGDRLVRSNGGKSPDELIRALGLDAGTSLRIPVLEDRDGIVAVLASWAGGRDLYRDNPALMDRSPSAFLAVHRKGNAQYHAV